MRICVIFNPTAKGNKARHFRRHLSEIAVDCALKPTEAAGAARSLACAALEEGFDTIVAAGGDGTVNEVINGMMDGGALCERARLGVIPLGTVNVFASEHGIPPPLQQAWQVILADRERTMDVPVVEFQEDGKAQRRVFAQMAGAGLDARAVELVSWDLKKKMGRLAYIVAGIRAMREKLPLIECRANGRSAAGELVLLGNGRFYGGPLPVFEHADAADGMIDVCVFPRVSWFALARYGIGYLTGRVHPPPDRVYLQAAEVELQSAERVPLELDGEFVGELPATVRLSGKRIRVVVG